MANRWVSALRQGSETTALDTQRDARSGLGEGELDAINESGEQSNEANELVQSVADNSTTTRRVLMVSTMIAF